jgi:hypothetical protein
MYTAPTVFTITLTLAATQYWLGLPAATKYVEIQCTTAVDNGVAFVDGGPYFTIKASTVYSTWELSPAAKTLYFYTANAGAVMQVFCYPIEREGMLQSRPVGA